MAYYIGILDGKGDVWGVRIPDAPGVHGGGATPEEAISDATSALREVGALLVSEGKDLPKPRSMTDVLADKEAAPDVKAGESAVMIPLLLDRGRSVRANISLDAGLLETFDAEAARRGLTRSAFFVSAASQVIAPRQGSFAKSTEVRMSRSAASGAFVPKTGRVGSMHSTRKKG